MLVEISGFMKYKKTPPEEKHMQTSADDTMFRTLLSVQLSPNNFETPSTYPHSS